MTKLGQFCERYIEAGWLLSVGLIPLYINFFSIRGYSVGKAYLLRMIVLLMVAAWVIKLWEGRGARDALVPALRNPLALPVAAFLLALLLSTAASVAPGLSFHGSFDRLQGASTTLIYIALFLLMALHLRTHEQFARIITVLLLASIPIALYALAQQWLGDPFSYRGAKADLKWPAVSTMGNHIFLGAYLIMLIPWTAARLIAATQKWTLASPVELRQGSLSRSWREPTLIFAAGGIILMNLGLAGFMLLSSNIPSLRWIAPPVLVGYLFFARWTTSLDTKVIPPLAFVVGYGCLILLQAIALAVTQARGPWISGLVGAALFALLIALSWRSRRLLTAAVACTAAVMLFVVLLNIPKGPLEPLKRHALLSRLGSLSDFDAGSIKYRFLVWNTVGRILWSQPEIDSSVLSSLRLGYGYGPETLGLIIERVLPPGFDRRGRWQMMHDRAHNDLLHHLVEGGLLGVGTFFWLLGAFYWMTLKALWQSQDHTQKLALAALIASISSHLIELQFGLGVTATRMLFWLSLALGLFLSQPPPADGIKGPKKGARKRNWMLLYILLVLVLALALAATEISSIETGLMLGFGGMFFGMALMASDLGPLSTGERLRWKRLWAHALVLGLAAILIFLGALRPLIADSYYRFGEVEAQKNDLAASIFAYQRSATWDPREENYYSALGLTLTNLGMMLLERRPDLKPPPGFRPSTALAKSLPPDQMIQLGGEGVLALAEASLMEASRLQPLHPLRLFRVAQLNHEWGLKGEPERLEKALVYYSEAHRMSPNRISILIPWAMLYLAKNDPNHALEKIQAAEALGADPRLIQKALAEIKERKFFP